MFHITKQPLRIVLGLLLNGLSRSPPAMVSRLQVQVQVPIPVPLITPSSSAFAPQACRVTRLEAETYPFLRLIIVNLPATLAPSKASPFFRQQFWVPRLYYSSIVSSAT
ncbi:hypothetical protein BDW69DRAFT_21027 [Aspergillus filifer]